MLITVGFGTSQLIQVLHEVGADLNKKSDNVTPLFVATSWNKVEVVNLLCNLGADVNRKTGLNKEISPLQVATEFGFDKTVRILHPGAFTQEVVEDGLNLADHALILIGLRTKNRGDSLCQEYVCRCDRCCIQ